MIAVNLDPNDQYWALRVAKERWRDGKGRPAFAGAKLEHHQYGAMAELAFCRALKLEWPASVNTFTSEPDVYPHWEIRWLSKWQGVKVRKKDPDDRLCVWVRGKMPRFEIMGYIRAGGAKRHREWYHPHKEAPYWLVPPEKMIPINPDFHAFCGFEKDGWGLFWCAFCGKESARVPSS